MPPASPASARSGGGIAAACAAICLSAAQPPGAFAGAGFLVVPGLALLYWVVTLPRRAAWWAYLAGSVHMACFSWSLRHVVFAAYFAVAVLGGLYYAILPRWVKGLVALRVPRPVAFGVAVAGAAWLRACMPEVSYPHGQPAHALYRAPWLLAGPAAFGGEVLVNLLLAALAAGLVDMARAVHRRAACTVVASVCATWLLSTFARSELRGERPPVATIDLAAIQPGLTVEDVLQRDATKLRARQRETLLRPTLAVAGADATTPPDLVVWPESTAFVDLLVDADGEEQLAVGAWWCAEAPLPLATRTKLLVGAHKVTPERDGTGVALLLDHRGRLLGYHEKLRLVAGGERQPFLGWLPRAWSEALQQSLARALGAAPHGTPGTFRTPMAVAEGVRAGALICFDNAFAHVARRHVEAGANLLVVVSNETWYRGGAELDQLAAMTVLRALETGVPIVRCTVDGHTLAIDPDGRVTARVPPQARQTLRIRVPVPATGGPVAPVAPAIAAGCAVSLALALAQGLRAWATLRRRRVRMA